MFEVNEDLWFGSTDDAAAEQSAAESMAAMVGRIIGAKPFPVAARRLEELTRNPSTRIDQIVRVLEGDPALSARLLRLVNSAGYALRLRCTSVRHAAALVGMRRLHQVATTAAVLDMFDSNSDAAVTVLEHAAIVGSFCRYLGVHLGLPRDELFTCGFLHDIGKLMLLDTEGAGYAALLEQHGAESDIIHVYEREKYGFDHAVLAAHVLSAWNIPDPVPKVVAWHHQVARAYQAGTTISAMVQALRLADALSYVVGKVSNYEALEHIANSEAAMYLEISEPQLAAMWNDLIALRQQSRVGARGSDVSELVVMPRREARPSIGTKLRAAEAPKHFPCVACKRPSYGNVCPCCFGHVCPEHQARGGEWCVLCVRDYERVRSAAKLDGSSQVQLGLSLLALGVLAGFGASSVPHAQPVDMMIGPILAVGLSAVLFAVARRWRIRTGFVRARQRKPRVAEGQAGLFGVTDIEPSLTTSSEDDSEPELLVIDNSLPPPGSSLRPSLGAGPLLASGSRAPQPETNGSQSPLAMLNGSQAPLPSSVASLIEPAYRSVRISIPCIAHVASNMPPASRTGFEGMAACSWRPPIELNPTIRLSDLPAAEPAVEPLAPSNASVRVVEAALAGDVVIHEVEGDAGGDSKLHSPAIAVRFSSIPEGSDSSWPKDGGESPSWPAHGRVTTWENTTERP